ncbi:hypothetical protein QBC44DRAFT_236780 [Cladorrhinum sp. PSN332]|nr:hypothetical protein QBC44DRAFT_236780 [Cladorrhinum sp. PSN332]
MAPSNGAIAKPDNPPRRTVPIFPVVPAIPLSYTQRPVKKQTPAAPPTVNGNPIAAEHTSTAASRDTNTLSPAPASTLAPATNSPDEQQSVASSSVFTPPTVVSGGHTRGISLSPSSVPIQMDSQMSLDASVTDPATLNIDLTSLSGPQSKGPINPTFDHPPATGQAPELPLPAPQPVMASRPAFHQAHTSNGSLVSGPFQQPNGNSVPFHNHPGAAMQYQQQQGYLPPQLGPLVSSSFDNWNPNRISHPNPHGPPTPHSFQGSQSSVPVEDQSYPQYPAMNGQNGYAAEPYRVPPPGLDAPFVPDQAYVDWLREAAYDNSFHDCHIDVQFTPSPEFYDHPAYAQQAFTSMLPGHRLIFSRSPTLKDAIKTQFVHAGGVIRLGKIADEYVRPDVFRHALGTLYAYELDNIPFPSHLTYRDHRDEFKTALSYIATARYLRLEGVEMQAAHRASLLLDWVTIEAAVRFVALNEAYSARAPEAGILFITKTVVEWLAQNFPLNFAIDINAGDAGFRRLPLHRLPSQNVPTPAIVNGSSAEAHSRQSSKSQVQMPRDLRVSSNPRLSQISFGEITSLEITPPSPSLFPNTGYSQARTVSCPKAHTLSKVLLHLPFKLLKAVLEHPLLAQPLGGYNSADRHAMVTMVIAAREAMRTYVVDKANTEFRPYQALLEPASKDMVIRTREDFWVSTMGFKEEVFSGDIPFLVRKWTGENSDSGHS